MEEHTLCPLVCKVTNVTESWATKSTDHISVSSVGLNFSLVCLAVNEALGWNFPKGKSPLTKGEGHLATLA